MAKCEPPRVMRNLELYRLACGWQMPATRLMIRMKPVIRVMRARSCFLAIEIRAETE